MRVQLHQALGLEPAKRLAQRRGFREESSKPTSHLSRRTFLRLTVDGQAAVAQGGLTSFREGVTGGEGSRTYDDLVADVGEENVIFARYERIPDAGVKRFTDRSNGLLNR